MVNRESHFEDIGGRAHFQLLVYFPNIQYCKILSQLMKSSYIFVKYYFFQNGTPYAMYAA